MNVFLLEFSYIATLAILNCGTSLVTDSTPTVTSSGSHIAGDLPGVSTAVVEENWDDDILDTNTDISPFGNC